MSIITTDLSVQKEWIARRGVNNTFTLTFTEDEDPFDLTDYTFFLSIRKVGANTQKLLLSQGSGLNNGLTNGVLSVQLSVENTEALAAQEYFYDLYYTIGGVPYGLLHGTLNLVKQYNEEQSATDFTIAVNLQGTELQMNVTLAGEALALKVLTQTTTETLTPDGSYDAFSLTAQTTALTIANPSTDYANFDGFMIRVYAANAQNLTFGSKYRAQGEALPTTTTISKVMVIVCLYDSDSDKYDTRFSEEI